MCAHWGSGGFLRAVPMDQRRGLSKSDAFPSDSRNVMIGSRSARRDLSRHSTRRLG